MGEFAQCACLPGIDLDVTWKIRWRVEFIESTFFGQYDAERDKAEDLPMESSTFVEEL